ncbi:MAG: ATP-binding cassette domain-containing protein [Acetivibrionales bacterium]
MLKSLYKIGISKVFINNLANTISQLSNFMGYLILLAVGVHQIQQGNLTLGGLVAFNAYSGSFRYSLLKISQVNAEIQQIIVSLKRVLDLVDRNKEKDQINKEKYVSFESPEMNIILRNLSFKYEASKPHIFKNLNIEIPSNKVTAIVGRSGIGKTTLLNIIMGLYKNYEGKIYINNVDYLNIPGSQLCQIISYVAQETFLLNDTIKENLLLAKPDAIDEELVEACKLSNIHEYINSLEKKYYTKLGPDGIQLSAGQRQRLAISRAVLRNAKIFLFDEITSALDVESEIFIKEMISQLSKNSTVVIVSHRLSTISEADNIIILKDNNVVEKLSINKTAEHYSHLQKLSKIIS